MITYYYICAENCISQSVLQLNEQKSYFHMKFLNKYFRFRKHREKIVNSNDIKIQGDVDFHTKFPSPTSTTQEVYGDSQNNKNPSEHPTEAFLPMNLALLSSLKFTSETDPEREVTESRTLRAALWVPCKLRTCKVMFSN